MKKSSFIRYGNARQKLQHYRFGFNGKETDRETQWQDYGFRIYYPGLGKFVSVDPLSIDFPWNSPYAFAENDVIRSIDLDGLEKVALSGFVPKEQYYLGYHVDGHTAYNSTHVKFFKLQGERLEKLYGFEAHQISTGKDLISKLISTTKVHGNISTIAIFSHGNQSGLLLKYNEGFYSGGDHPNYAGDGTIFDLVAAIGDGSVKFSDNAICFLDACGTGYKGSFAEDLCMATGITVIANAAAHCEMKDITNANGQFIATGINQFGEGFYKLTRVEKTKEVNINNPNKKWWQFWKSNTVKQEQKEFVIEYKYLGTEVNMDDYITK